MGGYNAFNLHVSPGGKKKNLEKAAQMAVQAKYLPNSLTPLLSVHAASARRGVERFNTGALPFGVSGDKGDYLTHTLSAV